MKLRWLTSLLLMLCLATPVLGADRIHPYTLQNWEAWQKAMQVAEDAVARKAPASELLKVLEATEAFYAEHRQVLERHPDYAQGLERQLTERLSLAKLYANMAFIYAKVAAEKKFGAPLTEPGGAFSRLVQADAVLKSYAAVKGESDPAFLAVQSHVAGVRKQASSVAEQLNETGVAVAPASATPVDAGTERYFRQWWALLDSTQKTIAAAGPENAAAAIAAAESHQQGWQGWLVKHSEYPRALARQQEMSEQVAAGQNAAHLKAAITQAKEGFESKNGNCFLESSGTNQHLAQVRKALAELEKKKGAADPAVEALRQALAAAEKQVTNLGNALDAEQTAARKMPADVYSGADKAALKASMLAYWKQTYPKDKVLGVRFFEAGWTRENNLKASINTIYETDYSWLPAKVVVESSAEVAALYPVFANRQNQEGGRLTISDDRSGSAFGVGKMLMKNVKF